ncbi:transmembrane 4 L6 family member 4 [Denticeps clupeoides]|uniref:transmembrane 4 L6 family member 4 n=1 Tax=Denticeps clupeoides TaxID=299321 RepID=UPI0010A54520|nr:transmembrane 4 L6 family member 4-like [Denticeps clupeoides]
MCTGKCAKCIAVVLYPLALTSIICNLMLFFPDWKTIYAQEDREGKGTRITDEVNYMGGVIGGGIMVLIPAIHIHLTGKKGCCANRCGMFLSIGFAAVGVLGALYNLATASVGLSKGPVCLYQASATQQVWGRPFDNNGTYLSHPDTWDKCLEPKDVVQFNVALFAILLVAACLELILCGFQMVNGLFGCICGTCNSSDSD